MPCRRPPRTFEVGPGRRVHVQRVKMLTWQAVAPRPPGLQLRVAGAGQALPAAGFGAACRLLRHSGRGGHHREAWWAADAPEASLATRTRCLLWSDLPRPPSAVGAAPPRHPRPPAPPAAAGAAGSPPPPPAIAARWPREGGPLWIGRAARPWVSPGPAWGCKHTQSISAASTCPRRRLLLGCKAKVVPVAKRGAAERLTMSGTQRAPACGGGGGGIPRGQQQQQHCCLPRRRRCRCRSRWLLAAMQRNRGRYRLHRRRSRGRRGAGRASTSH